MKQPWGQRMVLTTCRFITVGGNASRFAAVRAHPPAFHFAAHPRIEGRTHTKIP